MNVAVGQITLYLAESHSLKSKRGVLRSLITRVRQRFNVSIAEVEGGDHWEIATLGVCNVSNSASHARESLAKILEFIESEVQGEAEIVDCQREVMTGWP